MPPSPEPGDAELVSRARGGDGDAFTMLLLRHQDRVFQMAYRLINDRDEALDVAQEVFVTVHRNLARFEERARFSTWLYRITLNRCRDEMRRRASVKHTRPAALNVSEAFDPPDRGATPEGAALSGEATLLVQAALRRLPEESREICVLRDIEGLSYEEVAETLAIPVGTVRSRLNRARAQLRELLEPVYGPRRGQAS